MIGVAVNIFSRIRLASVLVSLFLVPQALAQKGSEQISEGGYNSAWSAGEENSMKFARVITITETSFTTKGEVVYSSRSELDLLGNQRTIYNEVWPGAGPSRKEAVYFDGKHYCREGDKAWMIGLFVCGIVGERTPGNILTEIYSRMTVAEGGKRYKALRRYVTFDDPYSFNKTPGQKSYYDKVSLIDARGRLVRESTKAGPIGGPKLDWTYEKTYVFDPTVRIQAPTK
jgi:hypothetical protein